MGGRQEVKMSEETEEKRQEEIFEAAQCLLSVLLASVAHGPPKNDPIVRRCGRGRRPGPADRTDGDTEATDRGGGG